MRKSRLALLFAVTASMLTISCISPKKVLYLQDMQPDMQIQLENQFEAVIAPYDELMIYVSCHDQDLAKPFNMSALQAQGEGGSSQERFGYLVDVNGNIQFPLIGEIHVAGLTRLQLQNELVKRLQSENYLPDPFVMVRFRNFKIFFLGADGGKVLNIADERCTFLEALAMTGDISEYTRRDKIAVLREVNGKLTMRYLDPRSSNVYNDPYFMLQQNDIIVTESIRSKYFQNELGFWVSWLSVFSSVTSIATILLLAKSGYLSF